jgi:hypothetical protein
LQLFWHGRTLRKSEFSTALNMSAQCGGGAVPTWRCPAVGLGEALPDQPTPAKKGLPAKKKRPEWTVTDDWPAEVPITEAEIEAFEAWFGDLFDELFSTRR